MQTKTKFFSIFLLSLSLVIPLSGNLAFLPAFAKAKAGAKTGSNTHVFTGSVLSVDTNSDTLSLYIAKNQRTYTVNYSSSRLLRGSGGGLQETEISPGDRVKVKGKSSGADITAKNLPTFPSET